MQMAITMDLTGKNALVTGGTRGIGRTISLRLAQAGGRVGMVYRADEQAAAETLRLLNETPPADHFALRADLGDEAQASEAMRAALERFGGALDILVLNAAHGTAGPVAE